MLAREYDIDINVHLDFGNMSDDIYVHYICDLTEKFGYGGRVAVGHVTKMSMAPPDQIAAITKRLVDTGVARPPPDTARRHLLAFQQQLPQSVHAVRGRLVDPDSQPVRKYRAGK